MKITINDTYVDQFIDQKAFGNNILSAKKALASLLNSDGKGNEYLGWINLPSEVDTALIEDISKTVELVKSNSKVLVIIGIGGSYLGSKAVISALTSTHHNKFANGKGLPEIYFAGTDLSGTELTDLIAVIGGRDFSINIISKSGTTTEPAIAFRVLRRLMDEKYGANNYANRIIATTDKSKGALRNLSTEKGYKTYVIPDDVGGRFSVFTPVGLIPIAAAGADIKELIRGAKSAQIDLCDDSNENIAIKYAALRNTLYENGKIIEILCNYEPRLSFIAAWWKQLFGESEGKEGKGIFPASVDFTCDLHSMGQYIQEGPRHLMETILRVKKMPHDIPVPSTVDNLDNLNYLSSKTINYINEMATQGTLEAHVSGNVPNVIIEIPELTAYHIGYLLYFFEMACGISAYMLGVNPFDQPGVESYKSNMFRLLGKLS